MNKCKSVFQWQEKTYKCEAPMGHVPLTHHYANAGQPSGSHSMGMVAWTEDGTPLGEPEPKEFPIKGVKLYFHRSKESNAELGEKLGLSGEVLGNFMYAGNEIEIKGYIKADGDFVAESLAGMPLTAPIEI